MTTLPDQATPMKEQGWRQWVWTTITQSIFPSAVVAIALLFVFGLMSALWNAQNVISPLADTEYARGLITFLVAFAAILIAVVLTLYTVLGSNDPEQEQRFNRGKEVLTIFIGILGTIVGFYYGSTPPAQGNVQALNTNPVVISNEQPRNGETISIMSLITGGDPPYTYAIRFEPENIIADFEGATSTDGVIQARIPISSSISSKTDVTFQIDVMDSAGKTVSIEGKQMTVTP